MGDELEVTTLSRDKSAVTPAKPPAIFLTCNELFLKGQTPRPGVNCIHTVVSQDYEGSEYSDVENIIDDVNVEEKVGKLLRSMQPQMPLDMMLLNERAMQAMLDDANELDYEFPDDKTKEEETSQKLIQNSSKKDSNE